jgi:hypothetical protein
VVSLGGVTETPVPLVAEMLPGVMTPVPLEKTPVRLELAPSVTIAGLAPKLEMAGGGILVLVLPPQPTKVVNPRASAAATTGLKDLMCVMASSKKNLS